MRNEFIEVFEYNKHTESKYIKGFLRIQDIYRIGTPDSKTKWVAVYPRFSESFGRKTKLFICRETYEALFNSMQREFIELFEYDEYKDTEYEYIPRGLFRKRYIYYIEIPDPKTEWVAVYLCLLEPNFCALYKKTKLFMRRETYETLFSSSETN